MKWLAAVALATIMLGMQAYAATPKHTPVTTAVTVAVTGFHSQACPDGLAADLAKLPGVTKVKATLKPARVTAILDETKTTAAAFVNAIAKHPQAMDAKKTYGATLQVYIDAPMCAAEAKMCQGCFTEIPKMLKPVVGITRVALDTTGKIASLTFDAKAKVTTAQIAAALKKSTYKFTVGFSGPVKPTTGGTCDSASHQCG